VQVEEAGSDRAIEPGRGTRPGLGCATRDADDPAVDALLWAKPPGESDGACNGGPPAGRWWAEQAIELVENAGR
jgi:endoglucanase